MPTVTEPAGSAAVQDPKAHLAQEARNQVNNILAQTNWQQYWCDVSEQAESEIDAYEAACARSLAGASKKFVH